MQGERRQEPSGVGIEEASTQIQCGENQINSIKMQQYIQDKLAPPMGFGSGSYALHGIEARSGEVFHLNQLRENCDLPELFT